LKGGKHSYIAAEVIQKLPEADDLIGQAKKAHVARQSNSAKLGLLAT
jgi:hypothetical protein